MPSLQEQPLDRALSKIGNYDLLEKIAEGGMGTVYKAKNRENGEIVALKVVPPHLAKNPILMTRFKQEFKVARMLDHPNVVRAIEFGQDGGSPYLAMEFVEGESIGDRIEREHRIPEADAIRLIAQAAQGLHKAHKKGLIHRDVKPDNILVTPANQAKLADLGLVKELETDLNLTRTGRGLGTPHFMAPEQFRNAKNADVRCDVYSLAATLYMMVTGALPFESCGPLDAWMKKINNDLVPPRKLNPQLSERVDWAIQRAMSADPTQRPTTCREFVEDLTGHSTRRITPLKGLIAESFWYLVYKDEYRVQQTVKGTLAGIRRSLKEGLLGDASNVRVSRDKAGPFEPLREHPEFRDLVIQPAKMPAPSKDKRPTPVRQSTPTLPRNKELISQLKKSAEIRPPNFESSIPERPIESSVVHIPLGDDASGFEFVRILLFLVLAAGMAVAGFFLMPWLMAFLN